MQVRMIHELQLQIDQQPVQVLNKSIDNIDHRDIQ